MRIGERWTFAVDAGYILCCWENLVEMRHWACVNLTKGLTGHQRRS